MSAPRRKRETVQWWAVHVPARLSEWSVLRCGERRARSWYDYRRKLATGETLPAALYRLARVAAPRKPGRLWLSICRESVSGHPAVVGQWGQVWTRTDGVWRPSTVAVSARERWPLPWNEADDTEPPFLPCGVCGVTSTVESRDGAWCDAHIPDSVGDASSARTDAGGWTDVGWTIGGGGDDIPF